MDKKFIKQLGDELYAALVSGKPVEPLTNRFPDITIEDGLFR